MASSSADLPAQQPADTETTPLLSADRGATAAAAAASSHHDQDATPLTDPGGLEAQLGSSDPGSASRAAAIRASLVAGVWFASWALLSISGITIVLSMVLFSLNTFTSRNVWLNLDGWIVLALAAFFSGFLAIVNLRTIHAAKIPGVLFNIFIHLLLLYASVAALAQANRYGFASPHCDSYDNACLSFKWIWDLVINTAFVSGVILGWFVHPALLIFWFFKARTAYGSPSRRHWLIPAGALTFEFTIRFSRQPSDDQVIPSTTSRP